MCYRSNILPVPPAIDDSNNGCGDKTFANILEVLADELEIRGGLDLQETFIDGSFAPKERGLCVGPTKMGKGTKIMAIADSHGFPISICIEGASPPEVTLVNKTLHHRFTRPYPRRMIGGKAYDADPMDDYLKRIREIEVLPPHEIGRTKTDPTQDGSRLRRYRRRWKVERLFAWLQQFRRIVVRWEFCGATRLLHYIPTRRAG